MVSFDFAELAARLEDSAFAESPRVTLDLDGWPGPIVAVDVAGLIGAVDAYQIYDRLVEIRNAAGAVVEELGYTPVLFDVPFPADGLSQYHLKQMVSCQDPASFNTSLADRRWDLERRLFDNGLFVPEFDGFDWDAAYQSQDGVLMRDEDEIEEHLEYVAERYYSPLGARPNHDEIVSATGPNGEPILDMAVADWWLHRWVRSKLNESTLVEWRARTGVYHTIDDPALLLLPSDNPAVAGLLPSGSGEYSFANGHQAWAEFVAKWHREWGAQLVSSGLASTFTVEGPPATIEAAIPLAMEHWFFYDGPSRAGDSVYEYAYSLVGETAWQLDVKP